MRSLTGDRRRFGNARWRVCRRFLASTGGVAAVELALVLPLLLLMLFGSIEIGTAVVIKSKVRTAASTIAEIANQYSTIQNADMTTILGTAAAVVAPYPVSGVSVVISQISIDGSGSAKVSWSDTLSGTARTVGSSVVLPSGIASANTSVLLSEVSYLFTPSLGYAMIGSVALSDSLYATPRNGSSITRTP